MIFHRKDIKIINFFVIFLALISCSVNREVPKIIQSNFTIKYDGQSHVVDSMIDINGYFTTAKPTTRRVYDKLFSNKFTVIQDTFYMNYVFFKDGIFLWNMYLGDCDSPECMSKSLKELRNDSLGNKNLRGNWGMYQFENDTIITQIVHKPFSFNDSWTALESKFKVIDRNTIIEIDTKPIHYMSKSDLMIEELYKKERKFEKAIFVPVEILPNSDNWLKEEKWFWKNDSINIK